MGRAPLGAEPHRHRILRLRSRAAVARLLFPGAASHRTASRSTHAIGRSDGRPRSLAEGPSRLASFCRLPSASRMRWASFTSKGQFTRTSSLANILVDASSGNAHLAGFGFASRLTQRATEARSADK